MYYPFVCPKGPLIILGTVKIVFSYIISLMTSFLHVQLYCPIISLQNADICAIITNMIYTLHDRGSDIVKDITYVK